MRIRSITPLRMTFLLGPLLLAHTDLSYANPPKDKAELIQKVKDVDTRCMGQVVRVSYKSYLWNINPKACLLHLIQCHQIRKLEKSFKLHDYEATIKQLREYVLTNHTVFMTKIESFHETPNEDFNKFAAKISQDLQAFANGCGNSVNGLSDILTPIEKLYGNMHKW